MTGLRNELRNPLLSFLVLIMSIVSCSSSEELTVISVTPTSLHEATLKPSVTMVTPPTRTQSPPTETSITETPTIIPIITTTPANEIDDSGKGVQYQDTVCGVEFIYPASWEVFSIEEIWFETDCSLGLAPLNWDQVQNDSDILLGEYAFSLEVVPSSFQEAVSRTFFVTQDGEWYVEGRQGAKLPAELMRTGDYLLLRGRGIMGVTSKDSQGYAGIVSGYRALLSDGEGRSVSFEAGPIEVGEAFEMVLRTFRFIDD